MPRRHEFPRIGRLLTCFALALPLGSPPAAAGEVDLASAGCPDLPPADRFMTVHLMLSGNGTASDCVISPDPRQYCDTVHAYDEGFLCIGMTHNPRPDITLSETTNSKMNDRLIIDGEEVPESYGKRILRRDLATGPSGGTYDVVAEQTVAGVSYALTVNVTASPDGPVRFNSVRLTYDD